MATTTSNLGLSKPDISDKVPNTIPALANNFDIIDNRFGISLGLNDNTISFTYTANGDVETATEKDKNNNVISATTYTYLANGDVDTAVKVMNGQTITTKYNYDANGNVTSAVNTKS